MQVNGRRSVLRVVDVAVIVGVILAVAFLAWRTPGGSSPDLIPTHRRADAVFALFGLAIIALVWPRRHGPNAVARGVAYLAALVLGGMTGARVVLFQDERGFLEPLAGAAHTMDDGSGPMVADGPMQRPSDAAEWALRVALHVGVDTAGSGVVLPIPDDWPLAPAARLGVERRADGGWVIWAQDTEASVTATCHARVAIDSENATEKELTPACEGNAALPAGVVMGTPRRGATVDQVASPGVVGAPWLQHRGNARREAVLDAEGAAGPGWRTPMHSQIRASASAAADVVLIGGHGTGLLVALDRRTGARRWSARTPNWIHHDAVSDGRVVVVGFGDSDRSFLGRAPSGVAAFDLATGRRLWTEFEERSVMTSPTILDSIVVYASSGGVVRKRLLATGQLLGTQELPGAVIMGPPVRTGDTLVATLDNSRICTVALATMERRWCREYHDLRMLGHASAAIDHGVVVISAVATALTPSSAELLRLPVRMQATLLREVLFPRYDDEFAGQLVLGLDLATGDVLWRSGFFPRHRSVEGHSAGTAAIQDGAGVIVLPMADTVVAFDVATGAIRWGSHANKSRGPPLILGNQVIIAGRNGVIEVRQLQSGVLQCTLRREVGYDRAGPILTGGMVVFANLDGEIEAMPATPLLACTAPGASRPGSAP